MEPASSGEQQAIRAITLAEYREWPDRLDWEEGPDVLRYPDRYGPASTNNAARRRSVS